MESKKHVFTAVEKKCFKDIIKKYSGVIENKNTDGASLRNKNKAWSNVTAEFNASPLATSQATHKQLRRLWMNLKQRQRETLIKEHQLRLATGAGPSTSNVDSDPDVATVSPALIVGIDSDTIQGVIDSDRIQEVTVECNQDVKINTEPVIVKEEEVTIEVTPDIFTPVSTPPAPSLERPQQPVAVQNLKLNVIEKEYEDRRQRADEKHKLEIQILEQQLRESKAKADLAEFILKRTLNSQAGTGCCGCFEDGAGSSAAAQQRDKQSKK